MRRSVSLEPNPYQSPSVASTPAPRDQLNRNTGVSILFIVLGAIFFVAHSYLLLRDTVANPSAVLSVYRTGGWFLFSYMLLYALVGLFACVFHVAYLASGRPNQGNARVSWQSPLLCLPRA
jgi:hypothetical protein